MRDRIKTLLVYANGTPQPRVIAKDTILCGVLRLDTQDASLHRMEWQRRLARRLDVRYENLSYVQDWHDAVLRSPLLEIDQCNVMNLVDWVRAWRHIRDYELVIILHSAAGDNLSLVSRMEALFQRRRATMLVLIGNEYMLMPEKIGFLRAVGAEFVGSQLPNAAARWLYAECDGTAVLPAPHALNPATYAWDPSVTRELDIGFIGEIYPWFIGDIERTEAIRYFEEQGASMGLRCDIRSQKIGRRDWANFLNRAKGIIGAESGTYYLERSDSTRVAVQQFQAENPSATFADVYARFFRDYPNPINGKAISSRHFEPIGVKTCQILLDGDYNGILHADEHYIALRRDLSNVREAVERFNDDAYRSAMVDATRDYVLAEHTYEHRVQSLVTAVTALPVPHQEASGPSSPSASAVR